MYKLELDKNGIIRGKCSSVATIEQMIVVGWEGPFVSDEIGRNINLPAEPIYEGENIIGGVHRPDLLPPAAVEIKPTADERIAVLEAELGALKKEQALLKVMNNAI